MYKQIVLLALVAQTISLRSSDNNTPDKKGINWWKASPTYWMFGNIPVAHAHEFIKVPVMPSDRAGGLATDNLNKMTENAYKTLNLAINNPEAMEKASHATGHGFVYGAVSAPFHAARDGVKSTAETVRDNPYAVGGTLAGLGILGAAIGYVREAYPSREEELRRAKIERKTAEQKHEIETLKTATELRTCLNFPGRCRQKGERYPRECNSPVRRMALKNALKANEILDSYDKFAD